MMEFITNKQELIENIKKLEGYLKSINEKQRKFAEDLVRRGKTICVYKVNGKDHFAPSRFIGYKKNNMNAHEMSEEKDGRDTNPVIDKILGRSFSNDTIEQKFIDYTNYLGIEAHNNKRKYWRLKDDLGKNTDIKL
jgi:hypothetical protein